MKKSVNIVFIMSSEDEINSAVDEISKLNIDVEYHTVNNLKMLEEILVIENCNMIILEQGAFEIGYLGLLKYLQDLGVSLPIIGVSDIFCEEEMLSAIEAGCADFLSRFDYANIKKAVYRILQDGRKAEREIKNLSAAITHSPSMFIITDKRGNCEYVNPKFTSVTGYELKDVIGKNVHDVLGIERMSLSCAGGMCETVFSGKEWKGETTNKKKDGKKYWAFVSIAPVKDGKGNITNFVASMEDITERKKLQNKVQRRNRQLQKLIDRLKAAQKRLVQQENLVAIGQLAAGVAHEINNPLSYVTSNFYTLKKYVKIFEELFNKYGEVEENIKTNYSDIWYDIKLIDKYKEDNSIEFILSDLVDLFIDTSGGLKRITEIVSNLLVFSRDMTKDSFEEYDINSGIENAISLLDSEISCSANITKNLGKLPLIISKENGLNQVWLNILSNAVYAVKHKRMERFGTIKITTYYENGFIFVIVNDNGVGIACEDLDKIFNPFFTRKPIGEGVGLGLSISYDIIVNKYSGEIIVESKQGIGTKVIVKIPHKQANKIIYGG